VNEAEVRERVSELTAEIVPSARTEAYRVWQRAPHALEMDELEAIALSGLAAAAARWPLYCREKGHDPEAWQFYRAYVTRRMRGAMLDYLRTQDWVTRSARTKAKALREAGQDRGLPDAELARLTGMTLAEVRETNAAVAARPVSMDAEPHDVAGEDDVEGQAVVSEVLSALSGTITRLADPARTILVLRYYHGMQLAELAPFAGVTLEEAAAVHQGALLAVHDAMLKVVA
jgi:RNA polymerase sigma factor FliA